MFLLFFPFFSTEVWVDSGGLVLSNLKDQLKKQQKQKNN